jgi:putative transposase
MSWEGCPSSCLAQSEHYVLACCRYIELNPVRAGMVGHFADYPWSSYRSNDAGTASALMSQYPLYRALGRSNAESCSRYRELFREHLEPALIDEIRQATNGSHVLGDARFSAEIEVMLLRRATPGKADGPAKTWKKSWSVPYFSLFPISLAGS